MWWRKRTLPSPSLPEGYQFTTHRDSFTPQWTRMMTCITGEEWSRENFQEWMLGDPGIVPESIFYLLSPEGTPVGSATGVDKGNGLGYLHMVALDPSVRGKGLALQLCAQPMRWLATQRDCKCVTLTTDDERIPAIKTYLSLGFLPVLTDESMEDRWRGVGNAIGLDILQVYDADRQQKKIVMM